jgi:hypothetical protein
MTLIRSKRSQVHVAQLLKSKPKTTSKRGALHIAGEIKENKTRKRKARAHLPPPALGSYPPLEFPCDCHAPWSCWCSHGLLQWYLWPILPWHAALSSSLRCGRQDWSVTTVTLRRFVCTMEATSLHQRLIFIFHQCWQCICVSNFVWIASGQILRHNQGTLLPLSVNPRYRIRETNVWCKNQSNKTTNTLIFERLLL